MFRRVRDIYSGNIPNTPEHRMAAYELETRKAESSAMQAERFHQEQITESRYANRLSLRAIWIAVIALLVAGGSLLVANLAFLSAHKSSPHPQVLSASQTNSPTKASKP